MLRTLALIYLVVGIALATALGLHMIGTLVWTDPLVPEVLHAMTVPLSLLTGFTTPDQKWMHLLVWVGSLLINFGLLSWLADNVGSR